MTAKQKCTGIEITNEELEPKTSRTRETKRLVIELPITELEDFKCISAIYGRTQTEMVARALREFIDNRKHLVKPYLDIRKQAEKELNQMKKQDRAKSVETSLKDI